MLILRKHGLASRIMIRKNKAVGMLAIFILSTLCSVASASTESTSKIPTRSGFYMQKWDSHAQNNTNNRENWNNRNVSSEMKNRGLRAAQLGVASFDQPASPTVSQLRQSIASSPHPETFQNKVQFIHALGGTLEHRQQTLPTYLGSSNLTSLSAVAARASARLAVNPYDIKQTSVSDPHALARDSPRIRNVEPPARDSTSNFHAPTEKETLWKTSTFPPVERAAKGIGARAIKSEIPDSAVSNFIGIVPWWTFIPGKVAGVGTYSINVANGNFVAQSVDMDVSHRDVGLTFTRTYNSQSSHDTSHTDGSSPSRFGNGWTSNIDMRLAVNSSGGISFFDATGARWDFISDGTGGWTAPAGQRSKLTYGGNAKYYLTQADGTTYYFWSPYSNDIGAGASAYRGLLNAIIGRNHNNYISFNYYFDNNDTSDKNFLNRVAQVAEDGTSATYLFSTINGFKELTSLTRPDGTMVQYTYADQAYGNGPGNNLWLVQKPGNNVRSSLPSVYLYDSQSYRMKGIQDPRSVTNFPNEGAEIRISYDATNRATAITNLGVLNFSPQDGTGAYLEPSLPTGYTSNGGTVVTYASFASGTQAGLTQSQDSDGHQSQYFFDTRGRVNAQDQIADSVTWRKYISWTANNYLSASTDYANANNSENFANNTTNNDYDASGNLVAVAWPQVTSSGATFRPTAIFSYDTSHNLTAACDAAWVHTHGKDWGAGYQSGISSCPQQIGATVYSWGTADYEPYGRLNGIQSKTGYLTILGYAYGPQDIGKPIIATGASFTQVDNSSVQPKTQYYYNSAGNLVSLVSPQGTATYNYDVMGRIISAADADNAGQSLSYYADGSLSQELPSGHTYSYDTDGNLITEVDHINSQANTTNYWYDGYGRLVEKRKPYGTGDAYSFAWMERNIYDLSKGNSVSIVDTVKNTSTGYVAHGNLYKKQKYLSSPTWTVLPTSGSPFWMDTEGEATDGLNRVTASYFFPPNSALSHSSRVYDNVAGRLARLINGASDQQNFTYDALGRILQASFTNAFQSSTYATPTRTYTYDASNHVISINTPWFGTINYAYNADGNLTDVQEAPGGSVPVSSPAHLTYHYYPNGSRAGLDVQSSALTQTAIKQYVYRNDGMRAKQYSNYENSLYQFSNTYTKAGRLLSSTDPLSGASPSVNISYSSQRPEWRATYGIPEGSYSNITRDQEGLITSYALPNGALQSMSYTPRGEIRNVVVANTSIYDVKNADGYMYISPTEKCVTRPLDAPPGAPTTKTCDTPAWAFDARTNGPIGAGYNTTITQSSGGSSTTTNRQGYIGFTYDSAGRRVIDTSTPQFDVENLTRMSQDKSAVYYWGGDHRLNSIVVGGNPRLSEHWDGNELLFTTSSATNVEQINLTKDATITPSASNKLTIFDRDPSSAVVSSRNGSGHDALVVPSPYGACDDEASAQYKISARSNSFVPSFSLCHSNGKTFVASRVDGYSNGITMFVGNLAYDVASLSYTTAGRSSGYTRRLQIDTAFATGDDYSSNSNFNKSAFGAGDGIINSNSQFGTPASAFGKSHFGQYYVPYSGPPEPDECTSFKGMCQIGGVQVGVWKNLNNSFGENPSSKSVTIEPDNSYTHYAVGFGMILSGSYNIYRFHDSPTVVQSVGYGGGYSYAGIAPVDVSVSVGHIYGPDNQPIVGEARADFLRGFGAGGTLIVGAGGSWSGNSSGHAYEVGVGNPQVSTGFSYGW